MSKSYLSPHGHKIIGTCETIPAIASIHGISNDGQPDYVGETEVDWDSQATNTHNGKILFVFEDYKRWTFDQLVLETDDAA